MQGADGAASALASLRIALSALQRLLAPFIPFATEEAWRWWQSGSVHRASWPTRNEIVGAGDAAVLAPISETLAQIRRAKTEAKSSQKTPVASAVVTASASDLAAIRSAEADLTEAGSVRSWSYITDESATAPQVSVELAADEPS